MSLPSLAVTLGYVRACGGDVDEWQERWRETARRLPGASITMGQADGRPPGQNGHAMAASALEPLSVEPPPEAAARPPGPELAASGESPGAGRGPRQLPAAVPHFSGRSAELAVLSRLVGGAGTTVVIAVVSGTAGVGKSALAVWFAHQAAQWFPDGQLYVDLRGFGPGGQVMDPGEAAGELLDGLGVPPQGRPVSVDGLAALYRSLLAGRRMLIVLDNARDSDQVRPLLPGTPGCLVLVTSRRELPSLTVGHGACPVSLDLLTGVQARALLAARLGHDEVAAEPCATDEIAAACAGLPLALAIVAARAAARPSISLRAVAGELSGARSSRLDALAGGETAADVRTVLSWSYQALEPAPARLFRLLSLHPGPDISAAAAASLVGLPLRTARLQLAELVQGNLAGEHAPGRYASHDLLRAYAAELTLDRDSAAQRDEATGRLLDYYLHSACAARLALFPYKEPIPLCPPRQGTVPETFSGREPAWAWLATERSVLPAAIRHAATAGHDAHAWQLARASLPILYRQGRWHEQAAICQAAAEAAVRLADSRAQAHSLYGLGGACTQLGRFSDARAHLRTALDLYRQSGDQRGQADARGALGNLSSDLGRHREALAHQRKALALYRHAGDRHGQAVTLSNMGYANSLLGDHHTALARCQQALAMLTQQDLSDRLAVANTWHSLGYARHHLGQHEQAADCYQRAISIYQDIGNAHYEGQALSDLADTYAAVGDPAASDVRRQALAILDGLAHPGAERIRTKLAAPLGPQRLAKMSARDDDGRAWP